MKLKNIILLGAATLALTACDDLFEPALENNQDIEQVYNDPIFARGLIDNAFLVIPINADGLASASNGISNAACEPSRLVTHCRMKLHAASFSAHFVVIAI